MGPRWRSVRCVVAITKKALFIAELRKKTAHS